MRFYLFSLILFCCLGTLAAQSVPAQNDPPITNENYREIYNKMKAKLRALGYPAGRAGNAAWARGQFTLRYEGGSAVSDFSADLAKLKKIYGRKNVTVLGECGCSDKFRIYNIHVTQLGGEEKGKGGSQKVSQAIGQEEVEPNYYIIPGLNQLKSNSPFNNLPPNFAVVPSGKPARPVTIAVLDTNSSSDEFCLDDDLFGWDFINDDNAPLDDHSHGTHIASGIATQLHRHVNNVNYRFMAVKMLDQAGVGTTFHASCAVAYAAYNGADVINASWGFYGERDAILQLPSILFVSASQTGGGTSLWRGTNFRSAPLVPGMDFVASVGTNITALVPSYFNAPNNLGRKTGTSVAAPFATALAAHYKHLHPGHTPMQLRTTLLTEINAQGTGGTINYLGTTIPYRVFIWINLP